MAGRTGFGLGLSIVDDIVRAHGGTIELLNRVPHGLLAQIELPAAENWPIAATLNPPDSDLIRVG
jgi:signal transduction histidine kinase